MGQILADVILIFAVIFLASLGLLGKGLDAEMDVFWHDDIGDKICAFGVIWLVAAVLRVCTNVGEWIASVFCAFGVFLFGHCLGDYGFFTALRVLGIFMFVLAYFTYLVVPGFARAAVIVGILLVVICSPLRRFDKPTNPEEEPAAPFTEVYNM